LTQIAASSPETPDGKGIGITTGFVVPYSPEYRIGGTDDGLDKLSRLAELTGGRVLDAARPEDAFAGAAAPKKQVRDLSRALLIAALALWLADIAARRLHVPWRRLALALSPSGARRPPADGSGSATLERLRSRVAPGAAAAPPPASPAAPPSAAPAPRSPAAAAAPASPTASPAASPPASPPSAAQAADGEADRLGRLLAAKKRRDR
jgi:hypothetical protein